MAYREVRVIEIKEVLRLWLAAVPKKRIAEMTRVDRKTVRRYITLATEHGLTPGAVVDCTAMNGVLEAARSPAHPPAVRFAGIVVLIALKHVGEQIPAFAALSARREPPTVNAILSQEFSSLNGEEAVTRPAA